ncbi:MAG: flagellar hook assembly protein FlgD, partial [Sphingobacteriales bacterium]
EYSISVKAWDGVNNSAEGSTTFKVIPSNQFVIDKVFNYPNPFTTNTSFQFEHNRPGTNLDIQIQIFSMSGRLIKVLEQNIYSTGSRVSDLNWNGLDDFGDQIGKGVYVYRVMVRTPNGLTAEKFEKLVTLR